MIKQFDSFANYDPQHTSSSSYYGQQAQRFQSQQAMNPPRSTGAWRAEQSLLGSWNTGVGRPMRNATGYQSGVGNALFDYSRNSTTGSPTYGSGTQIP